MKTGFYCIVFYYKAKSTRFVRTNVPLDAKPEPARGFPDLRDLRHPTQLALVLWLVSCSCIRVLDGRLTLVDR